MFLNFKEAVEYIYETPKFTKKNDLQNTKFLFDRLGQPGIDKKIIHVAGTNGKGSVCAYLSGILKEAGYKVGLFTSPHLVDINERIRINYVPVSNEEFLESFCSVKEAIDEIMREGYSHPTFFEILFLIAMIIFEKRNVEYIILETGLGGRLDATNVFMTPAATIITSIDLDHTEYLGDTIEKIAEEKSGIIKPYIPVICDGTKKDATIVICDKAGELNAPFYIVSEEEIEVLGSDNKQVDFYRKYGYYKDVKFLLPTIAEYQALNAGLAIQTIEILHKESPIEASIVKAGLEKTYWPGRMEEISEGIILDGAHNLQGITEFIHTINKYRNEKSIILLFSAVKEKNYETIIQKLCRELFFDKVFVTQLDNIRAIPLETLISLFEKYTDKEVNGYDNTSLAFEKALEIKSSQSILACAGSLYLVGEIKEIMRRKKND